MRKHGEALLPPWLVSSPSISKLRALSKELKSHPRSTISPSHLDMHSTTCRMRNSHASVLPTAVRMSSTGMPHLFCPSSVCCQSVWGCKSFICCSHWHLRVGPLTVLWLVVFPASVIRSSHTPSVASLFACPVFAPLVMLQLPGGTTALASA